jgi:putative lipoprotein
MGVRPALPRRLLSIGVLAMTSAHACASEPAAPSGAWTAVEIGGMPTSQGVVSTLEFGPDGSVSGTGGCNRYRGRAEITAGTIVFSPLAATRMACPGPAMEQERRLFAALAAARRFRVEGGALALLGEDSAVVARFSRGA